MLCLNEIILDFIHELAFVSETTQIKAKMKKLHLLGNYSLKTQWLLHTICLLYVKVLDLIIF